MDIKGLDMLQISNRMEACLTAHFPGYALTSDANGIFQEVIRLQYDEIDHLIIQPEHKPLFNTDEWFLGASGIIELSNTHSGGKETYTVMLVLDEPQTKALFLYVSKWDASTVFLR